jgi:hypothetical protein
MTLLSYPTRQLKQKIRPWIQLGELLLLSRSLNALHSSAYLWHYFFFFLNLFALQQGLNSCTKQTISEREFRARFKKDAPHKNIVFFKPHTKLTLHCNHRSGHLKTEHTESLLLLRRHLGNWFRGPTVSMRSELLVAHERLGQFPLLIMYVVPI